MEQGLCRVAWVDRCQKLTDVRNYVRYHKGYHCPSNTTTRQRTLPGSMASKFLGSGFERFGVKGLATGSFSKNILQNGRPIANLDLMEIGSSMSDSHPQESYLCWKVASRSGWVGALKSQGPESSQALIYLLNLFPGVSQLPDSAVCTLSVGKSSWPHPRSCWRIAWLKPQRSLQPVLNQQPNSTVQGIRVDGEIGHPPRKPQHTLFLLCPRGSTLCPSRLEP